MTNPAATILQADARALPLADASVDLVVTSPPYFGLRSYQDAGEHYAGQLGSETTPAEYVDALIACTREMMRVLKPTGSIWVNLGDKFSGAGPQNAPGRLSSVANSHHWQQVGKSGIPHKSLMGIPWRYALRCIDELGLILRAEVIWSKPNGLPESVTDRVRRSHEQWFHFVKQPRYFSACDTIRESHSENSHPRRKDGALPPKNALGVANGVRNGYMPETYVNPLGKLPGSVWEIPSQPLTVPENLGVDHFAAFPVEWPRRIILGWSPSGICTECGEGRRATTTTTTVKLVGSTGDTLTRTGVQDHRVGARKANWHTLTGYACACPEPTAASRPSVVLDPFGGTGTAALAAKALGRHGISVDMSADYCRIARWRTNDPGELARALGVAKPPAEINGQTSLLELIGGAS